MRRSVLSVLVGVCLGTAGPAAASVAVLAAEPGASAQIGSQTKAVPGTAVCTIQDERLISLSGMGALASGYVVVNDFTGSSRGDRVFFLDRSCKVARTVTYPGGPRDPEDLAVARDGTVWVADVGDNSKQRSSIALWKVPANGTPVLYRLRYPDGRHDAEALLLDATDQPIVVTKDASLSRLYVPAAPIAPASTNSQGVAMKKVGEFKPQRTGTSTPLGFIGQIQVTGGANAPDRTRVVLRTYSDAYEWDVPDGDVIKAITTGKPRITPLPDEPWGESITYSTDGASFLTVSETENLPADERPQIRRYAPATAARATAGPAAAVPPRRNSLSWFERLSLTEATTLIAAVGAVGVLLVVVGVVGILRARRRPVRSGSVDYGAQVGGEREPAAAAGGGEYRSAGYGDPAGYDGYGSAVQDGYGPEPGHRPDADYRAEAGYGAIYGGGAVRGDPAVRGDGSVYGAEAPSRGAVYGGGTRGYDAGSRDDDPGGYGPAPGYPPQRGR